MITTMLSDIICYEFETHVGRWQSQNGEKKCFHIGFGVNPGFQVVHMYIFAPKNYVYVATQLERRDEDGRTHMGEMKICSYHDSCWADAISSFISKNQNSLTRFIGFKSLTRFIGLKLLDWYDVLTLSDEEIHTLELLERIKYKNGAYDILSEDEVRHVHQSNPFNNRLICK